MTNLISINQDEINLAGKVAHRVGSKWSAVEIDDLTSHLYLWMATNTKALQRWRDEVGGQGKLYVSLRRIAGDYCAREQAHANNQPLDTGSIYTPDMLDKALPFIFEEWPQTMALVNPVTGQAVTSSNPQDHGNAVAILADITGAYHGLPKDDKRVLSYRYEQPLTFAEIGELEGITKDGAKKRVNRALTRLAQALATGRK